MARLPLVSPLDRALFLKTQPYLEGVGSNVLAALASYTEEREYPRGSLIRDAGVPVESICFLGTGAVSVSGSVDGTPVVRTVEAPGAVGLAHAFANASNPPQVRAIDRTLCLEVAAMDFLQILEDHFPLLLQIARTSCKHALSNFRELGVHRADEEGFSDDSRIESPAELDLVQRLGLAKRMPFFQGVNLTVLGELIRFDAPNLVPAGTELWRAGDPIDRMVLVLDGSFRSKGEFGSCTAPVGAMLGGWEILSNEPRFEGWVANEPSRVLSIDRELFTDVLEDHFEFAMSYLGRLSSCIIDGWDRLQRRALCDEIDAR